MPRDLASERPGFGLAECTICHALVESSPMLNGFRRNPESTAGDPFDRFRCEEHGERDDG